MGTFYPLSVTHLRSSPVAQHDLVSTLHPRRRSMARPHPGSTGTVHSEGKPRLVTQDLICPPTATSTGAVHPPATTPCLLSDGMGCRCCRYTNVVSAVAATATGVMVGNSSDDGDGADIGGGDLAG
jgi:hypothetical protein